MTNDAVTVAYIHSEEIAHSFHQSLLALVGHDLNSRGRVATGGWLATRCYGADGIPGARNLTIQEFLRDRTSEWLLWIDTDMGFEPDTVDRLIAAADPVKRPIVGALCFAHKANDPDGMGGWRHQIAPTVFEWGKNGEQVGFCSVRNYPINTLMRVSGTGSACILIHRSVFEKMQDKYGDVWYERVANPTADNKLMGEDLSFCLRAGAMDIPVYVHTGIRTTHLKNIWLSEIDYWRNVDAEPATEATAVIVPVMKRPQSAEPFMRALKASTGLAKVYAVCDYGDADTAKAWKLAGARTITFPKKDDGTAGTFAEKVNYGYARTKEPWLFLAGDDVRFHAGWLDHAQAIAGKDFHVIGTNDLGNPLVMAGECSGHLLIRRSYVDEQGTSWDGPKVVAHEGYHHWFVDQEMIVAARQHGAWAMAMGSIVEHLHPLWGKGDDDEVYALGRSFNEVDKDLYKQRHAENVKVDPNAQ